MRKMDLAIFFGLAVAACTAIAQTPTSVILPPPQTQGGKPLMQVLNDRKSIRAFQRKSLPTQQLSDLLWAACGINRTDGRRTAPSARNRQEIDVYVALEQGLFLYDPKAHALVNVLADDIRAATGTQSFVAEAPVNLIYVADLSKVGNASDEDKIFYPACDTGFIAQNVYLYCASAGLATVVRGLVDRPALALKMKIRSDQKVILAQTIGYPQD